MNSINVVAVTPVFMTAHFGTGLLRVALVAWALVDWDSAYSPYLVPGAWNHVRVLAGIAAAAALTLGIHAGWTGSRNPFDADPSLHGCHVGRGRPARRFERAQLGFGRRWLNG